MTRRLVITLLVLSGGPAYAEWVPLDPPYQSPGLQTVYVDPDTMMRAGQFVTLWQLTDFTWMQGGRKGTRFFSTMTQSKFNCANKRVRLLAFAWFSLRMGRGKAAAGYVDTDHWLPVKPESPNQGLWEWACGKS